MFVDQYLLFRQLNDGSAIAMGLHPVSECPSAYATKATANRRHQHIFCILSATCETMEEIGVLSSRTHDRCKVVHSLQGGRHNVFSSSAAYIRRLAEDVCYSLLSASC